MDEVEKLFSSTRFLIDLDDEDGKVQKDLKYNLWGKLLIDKPYNIKAMITVFWRSWNPMKGMETKELENGIVCFMFSCEADVRRVEDKGPWNFGGHVLLTRRWEPELAPSEIVFHQIPIWVQLSSLPLEWYKTSSIERIGKAIGEIMDVDLGEEGRYGFKAAKVRIRLGINNSLMLGIWIKRKIRDPCGSRSNTSVYHIFAVTADVLGMILNCVRMKRWE